MPSVVILYTAQNKLFMTYSGDMRTLQTFFGQEKLQIL